MNQRHPSRGVLGSFLDAVSPKKSDQKLVDIFKELIDLCARHDLDPDAQNLLVAADFILKSHKKTKENQK